MKNQYRGGDCLKRGAWTVCRFKGSLARKRRWCFGEGVDTPMHIMGWMYINLEDIKQTQKSCKKFIFNICKCIANQGLNNPSSGTGGAGLPKVSFHCPLVTQDCLYASLTWPNYKNCVKRFDCLLLHQCFLNHQLTKFTPLP